MSLRRNLLASALGDGWAALIQLMFVPVYVAVLGVEAYGLIGAVAVFSIFSAVLDAALGPPISREVAAAQADLQRMHGVRSLLRSIEVLLQGAAVAIVAAGVAGAGAIAGWVQVEHLEASSVAMAMRLFFLHLAVRLLVGPYRAVLVGAQDLMWLNGFAAGIATLRGVAVIPAMLAWPDIQAYFAFQAAVGVIEVVLLARRAWRLLPGGAPPSFSRAALGGIGRFALGAAWMSVLWHALHQSDRALLSAGLSLAEVGQYALAASAAAALALVVGPFAAVGFARFAALAARRERAAITETFHRLAQGTIVLLAPAAFTLGLFAEPLLQAWTGDPTLSRAAAPVLALLAVGGLLKGCMSVPYTLSFASGRAFEIVLAYSAMLAVFVPATYFGTASLGAAAAAYAWIAVTALGLAFAFPLVRSVLSPEDAWRWLASDVALPVAAAGVGSMLIRSLVERDASAGVMAAFVIGAFVVSFGCAALVTPGLRARAA